jgi:excisionase family DNA binding protein
MREMTTGMRDMHISTMRDMLRCLSLFPRQVTNPKEEPLSKKVYTTAEAARLLGVSQRTVCRWFDAGRLRGHRLHGDRERRIPREQLIRFFRANGKPVPDELTAPIDEDGY